MLKTFMWILWPSFIAAGIGVGILFTLIDPQAIIVYGAPLNLGNSAVHSIGFFMLWALCAGSSAISCLLQGNVGEQRR